MTLATKADTDRFIGIFKNTTASNLATKPKNVHVVSVTATTSRRLESEEFVMQSANHRPYLQTAGVSVYFNVTTLSSYTDLNTALTSSTSISAMTTALTPTFPNAVAQTATAFQFTPTSSPVTTPSSGSSRVISNIFITISLVSVSSIFLF